jgi:SAM-dependent methyltransferase
MRLFPAKNPSAAPSSDGLTEADIRLAYRAVLRREPDDAGLHAYLEQARHGLSFRALIESLAASDEFRGPDNQPDAAVSSAQASPAEAPRAAAPIRPEEIIARYSLRELNETAEEYYRRVGDPTPLMAKPFAYWHEAPQMLQDLGALFDGLHMGKAMRVLDFGAGTCWVTWILAQLDCEAVACDVSPTALSIGRRLFEERPPIGRTVFPPEFLPYDGRTLPLPDESLDRIVCFDAFHHVPNPGEVLAEFARVLKPGGLAGFSEPGPEHSQSAQSQYEMRHHRVLENDIALDAIFARAQTAGFTHISIRALTDQVLSLAAYRELGRTPLQDRAVADAVLAHVARTTSNRSVFFLHKGPLVPDSRRHEGLAHRLHGDPTSLIVDAGEPFEIRFRVENTGTALWLHEGRQIFGLVRLGAHLADAGGRLIELDFSRTPLPRAVPPNDSVDISTTLGLPRPGRYRLTFDLVAEGVSWFENLGSVPCVAEIVVN